MTIEEIEAVKASIVYDDGQNVRIRGMKACPFCGCDVASGSLAPFVQVGPSWGDGSVEARVVCGCCHVSTSHEVATTVTRVDTGEDVTRYAAIIKAVERWNQRAPLRAHTRGGSKEEQ